MPVGVVGLPKVLLPPNVWMFPRVGISFGRVDAKRMTFKRPEEENRTLANAVASNGTDLPENAIHRTMAIGATVMI